LTGVSFLVWLFLPVSLLTASGDSADSFRVRAATFDTPSVLVEAQSPETHGVKLVRIGISLRTPSFRNTRFLPFGITPATDGRGLLLRLSATALSLSHSNRMKRLSVSTIYYLLHLFRVFGLL